MRFRRPAKSTTRRSRQFAANFGSFNNSQIELEAKSLTAPTFIRAFPVPEPDTIRAGSNSIAGDDGDAFAIGTGTGWDGVFAQHASATTLASGVIPNPFPNLPPIMDVSSRGNVDNRVTGPNASGTNDPADPNPPELNAIQAHVVHTHHESVTNNDSVGRNPRDFRALVGSTSRADTGGKMGALHYEVQNGAGDVTFSFEASIQSGGDPRFAAGGQLSIATDWFTLSINVTAPGLQVVDNAGNDLVPPDPNFGLPQQAGGLVDDQADVSWDLQNIQEDREFFISYDSLFDSDVIRGGGPSALKFAPGETATNDSSFEWNFSMTIV